MRSRALCRSLLRLVLAATLGSAATNPVRADEDARVAWLRQHAIPIATLDPNHPNLADLEPLRAVLDGVRVVLLGEATRGDGSAFLAKTRLIRFLHDALGFDLLVLECGFYDCAHVWREIRAGADARAALGRALFPFYTEAVEFQPLIDLLASRANSPRPLELAGFDNQMSLDVSGRHLLAELRSALGGDTLDATAAAALKAAEPMLAALFEEAYATGVAEVPPAAEQRRFLATLDLLRRRLETLGAERTRAVDGGRWLQVVANLESWAKSSWKMGRFDPDAPQSTELHNLRDRQMAENLLWLAKREPARKIVVWSLTVHLARDLDRLTSLDPAMLARLGRMSAVGDLVSRELRSAAYTLAVTAAEGFKGTPFRAPYPLLTPTRGSFEELMSRTGLAAGFVDLRHLDASGSWLRRSLIAKPISYVELLGIWPRHLDGLLFLRALEPAHRVPRPAGETAPSP